MLHPPSYHRADPDMSSPTHGFKESTGAPNTTPFGYTFHSSDQAQNRPSTTTSPLDKLNFASNWEPDPHNDLLSPNEWQTLDDFFLNPDQHVQHHGSFSQDQNLPLVLDVFGGTKPDYTENQPFSMPGASSMNTTSFKESFGPMSTMFDPTQGTLPRRHTEGDVHRQPVLGYDLGSPLSHLSRPDASHPNFSTGDLFDMSHMTGSQPQLVPSSQGAIHEQLAAILPNHAQNGSIDASLAAGFSQTQNPHPSQASELERSKGNLKRSYTYGTDKAFNPAGYIPDSDKSTHQAVERRLMRDLNIAQPATKAVVPSAGNTRTSSPVTQGFIRKNSKVDESFNHDGIVDEQRDSINRPTKKRKGKSTLMKREEEEEEEEDSAIYADSAGSKARGRRKSAAEKRKENLSDEQKRTNHIISEQKRRGVIKEGYNDLLELVPGLKNAGLNKAAVLAETFKFLEDLMRKNRELELLIRRS